MKLLFLYALAPAILLWACAPAEPPAADAEEEMLSRTEFTDRIENFFEYAPLKAGQPSEFLIHLTDLSDGAPVEGAQVRLTARREDGAAPAAETVAQIGRVTGIYVAELTLPSAGAYQIEFSIRNARLDERMLLSDFQVE